MSSIRISHESPEADTALKAAVLTSGFSAGQGAGHPGTAVPTPRPTRSPVPQIWQIAKGKRMSPAFAFEHG